MIKYLYFAVPVHALHAIYCGPYDIKSKMNKLNYLKKKFNSKPNKQSTYTILYSPFNSYQIKCISEPIYN